MNESALYVLEPLHTLEETSFHPFYELRASIGWDDDDLGKCLIAFFVFNAQSAAVSGDVSLLFAGPVGNFVYRRGAPRTATLREGFRLFPKHGIESDAFLFTRIHHKHVAGARIYQLASSAAALLLQPQYDLRLDRRDAPPKRTWFTTPEDRTAMRLRN